MNEQKMRYQLRESSPPAKQNAPPSSGYFVLLFVSFLTFGGSSGDSNVTKIIRSAFLWAIQERALSKLLLGRMSLD